jgi:predicted nucleic acid-binding protein
MIIIDTSGWIEFLRDTDSLVCNTVDALLDADLAICDAISMEVLAGARDERHLAQLRGLLARATLVPVIAEDYDQAAALYRACRRNGETVRKLIDCLIAAVAIRANAPILHADADFAALARHTPVAVHPNSAT